MLTRPSLQTTHQTLVDNTRSGYPSIPISSNPQSSSLLVPPVGVFPGSPERLDSTRLYPTPTPTHLRRLALVLEIDPPPLGRIYLSLDHHANAILVRFTARARGRARPRSRTGSRPVTRLGFTISTPRNDRWINSSSQVVNTRSRSRSSSS